MKKALFAVAAVALLAVVAQAGEIKYHEWPCDPCPQEVTTVPVWLELPRWVWQGWRDARVLLPERQGMLALPWQAWRDAPGRMLAWQPVPPGAPAPWAKQAGPRPVRIVSRR